MVTTANNTPSTGHERGSEFVRYTRRNEQSERLSRRSYVYTLSRIIFPLCLIYRAIYAHATRYRKKCISLWYRYLSVAVFDILHIPNTRIRNLIAPSPSIPYTHINIHSRLRRKFLGIHQTDTLLVQGAQYRTCYEIYPEWTEWTSNADVINTI